MADKLKILIIEDEEPIRRGLSEVFLFHGYHVESAADGESGLRQALGGSYDLILLDIMLPERDGFSVCREIRKVSREQPIIMLTARADDDDVIQGLSLGADDYVAKPFSVRELVLRAEAILRRSAKLKPEIEELEIGDLRIDPDSLTGRRRGAGAAEEPVVFTRREMDLLEYLWRHPDHAVKRADLLKEVWGYSRSGSFDTRTVDIHIAKIRRRIEADPKNPKHLITVRGEGYQLKRH